ncbi:AGAP009256-PA [Anopheles gambiae str. PEST]|uniref:Gustatory receptor n=1 Tax=Anopheles gambiae TaxID=7165 RepID=Q7PVK0_ANOGA|nr:AGAP009256-PA [Anopheles gambiae str. PEST]
MNSHTNTSPFITQVVERYSCKHRTYCRTMPLSELLARLVHLKMVALGVVPYEFHPATLSLQFSRSLLVYCFIIAIISPLGRCCVFLTTFFTMKLGISVVRYTAMFRELLDAILLVIPPCYLLCQHAKVKQLFELSVEIYRSSLPLGIFPFWQWFRTCLLCSLVYDSVYGVNVAFNLVLPGAGIHAKYVQILLWSVLSQLTKSVVLLIIYGTAQYLLMMVDQLKDHLVAGRLSTNPVYQEQIRQQHHGPAGYLMFYEQLAKVCETLNDLIGVPLITYFLMALIHLTFVCYLILTKLLVRWSYITWQSILIAGIAIASYVIDLLCLMRIVGTFARTREESLKTQKLLLRLNLSPMDHKLKQSIEVFALQTLHQPIEFTACRMFTLDYTVLFSIAAAVTNYLIILIQFEMAIEQ